MKNQDFSQKPSSVQYQNENAFTLLEVLVALSILATIVFFITPVLQIIIDNRDTNNRLQEMEWEVFSSQMKKEIRMSTKAEVVSGRLVLTNNNDTIYIELYGSNIRRRVNSTGHETLLQNVSVVTFTQMKNAVKIKVKDIPGNEYTIVVHSYIRWAVAS